MSLEHLKVLRDSIARDIGILERRGNPIAPRTRQRIQALDVKIAVLSKDAADPLKNFSLGTPASEKALLWGIKNNTGAKKASFEKQLAALRAKDSVVEASADAVVEANSDDVRSDFTKKGNLLHRYKLQLQQATHFYGVVSKQLSGAKNDPKKAAEIKTALGKWQHDIDEARAEISKLEPVVAKLKEKIIKAEPGGRMAILAAGR